MKSSSKTNSKLLVPEVDILSILFMLLVIFIHCVSECVSSFLRPSIPFTIACSAHRLSSFVVQGFVFLSGLKLFINMRDDFNAGRFYISRIKRVLIPYVAVFTLFFTYFCLTGRCENSLGFFTGELFTCGLVSHFYYIAVICQFYILVPLFRVIIKRYSPVSVLIFSLLLMIILKFAIPDILKAGFGITFEKSDRLFTSYLIYFIGGMFAGTYYDKFKSAVKSRFPDILLLFVTVGIIDCILILVIYNKIYYPVWAETFHVLYCMSAIVFTYSAVCHLPTCRIMEFKAFKYLSRASYNVYLIHPLFIFLTDSKMNDLNITSLTLRFFIKTAVTYVLSLGICVLFEVLKDRIKNLAKSVQA